MKMKTEDINREIKKRKILFVCLGNICRSPSAEEIMRTMVKAENLEKYFELDSAGISSYHRGELSDPRMRNYAKMRGYNLTHRSRPVETEDFYNFDLLIGMDDRNIASLKDMAPGIEEKNKVVRMTDFCQKKIVDYVPDPYYDGGFDNVIDILEDACQGLLEKEKEYLHEHWA